MSTYLESDIDDCIRVPDEEQSIGGHLPWPIQDRVALSAQLIAWPELDAPHWFDSHAGQLQPPISKRHAC